ncbi:hypothetical protein Aspvir_000516 [Aspergillus viridinutans]|uniref:Uncharacterized protein n=1 Tax=Aspergillus viridinutans TaxID=75553 RepID=A0A9P3BL08_ASPVI|nr:uncharacterized protein Aspvir_000516 [Aspergillus viridinutans]GIJ98399.1 hypothetical protein Aspvir_000516 [Aspergillus viridinutans]
MSIRLQPYEPSMSPDLSISQSTLDSESSPSSVEVSQARARRNPWTDIRSPSPEILRSAGRPERQQPQPRIQDRQDPSTQSAPQARPDETPTSRHILPSRSPGHMGSRHPDEPYRGGLPTTRSEATPGTHQRPKKARSEGSIGDVYHGSGENRQEGT